MCQIRLNQPCCLAFEDSLPFNQGFHAKCSLSLLSMLFHYASVRLRVRMALWLSMIVAIWKYHVSMTHLFQISKSFLAWQCAKTVFCFEIHMGFEKSNIIMPRIFMYLCQYVDIQVCLFICHVVYSQIFRKLTII